MINRRFYMGGRVYELETGWSGSAGRVSSAPSNPFGVQAVLRSVVGDPAGMAALRATLHEVCSGASVHRMSDHQVLEQLKWQLDAGRVRLTDGRAARSPAPRGGSSRPAPRRTVAAEAPPVEESFAPAPPPEAPIDEERVDAVAQAHALKQAAQNGTPFCEQCEAAKGQTA